MYDNATSHLIKNDLDDVDFKDTILMKWLASSPDVSLKICGAFWRKFRLADWNLAVKINFGMLF